MSHTEQKPKLSNRKQTGKAIERLDELEAAFPQVVLAVNKSIGTLQNQLSHNVEIVNALVSMLGADAVAAQIEQNRLERTIAEGNNRKQMVVKALENGKLVTEDIVRPAIKGPKFDEFDPQDTARWAEMGSFVATLDYDGQGTELPGSYRCIRMAGVHEDFAPAFAGKEVGYEHPAPLKDGQGQNIMTDKNEPEIGKVVIVGIYKQVPNPTQAATVKPTASETPEQMANPTEGPVTDVQPPGIPEPQPEQAAPSAGA